MIEPARGPVALVAARLDCTEGQLYTMVIGLAVALLLGVPGIPAVLRDRPAPERTDVALRPFADGASAAPTLAPVSELPSAPSGVTPGPPFRASPFGVAAPAGASTDAASATDVVSGPVRGGSLVPAPGTIATFARVGHPGAPGGLAVATDGTVFVTTDNGSGRGGRGPSHVFAYDSAGTPITRRAIAGQPRDRIGGLTGAAVHPGSGDVAVLDPEGARIVSVDMSSGTQTVLATIPDLPACLVSLGVGLCQPGIDDRKPFPMSAVYDQHDNLFFSDPAQGTIWRLRPAARSPEVWYQSIYFASGDGPYGLAMRGGSMSFTVGTSIDPSAFDKGALYRLAINADGSAGDLTLVHAFEQGDQPGALAVASSGTAYVVLRNSGAIVTLGRDGSQSGRIDPPGTGGIPLDAPSALALAPGALLVANGRTSADPTRWAILKVILGR